MPEQGRKQAGWPPSFSGHLLQRGSYSAAGRSLCLGGTFLGACAPVRTNFPRRARRPCLRLAAPAPVPGQELPSGSSPAPLPGSPRPCPSSLVPPRTPGAGLCAGAAPAAPSTAGRGHTALGPRVLTGGGAGGFACRRERSERDEGELLPAPGGGP